MNAFRVQVNRDETVTAGLSGLHVVSVFVEAAERVQMSPAPDLSPIQLRLSVFGLRISEDGPGTNVLWGRRSLKVGDEITISVVDVSESGISPPIEESAAAEASEDDERKQLAALTEKYGAP
jgi:hypothetical protein